MTETTCKTCRYWYSKNFEDLLREQGKCKRFPKWENTDDRHHCGEHSEEVPKVIIKQGPHRRDENSAEPFFYCEECKTHYRESLGGRDHFPHCQHYNQPPHRRDEEDEALEDYKDRIAIEEARRVLNSDMVIEYRKPNPDVTKDWKDRP